MKVYRFSDDKEVEQCESCVELTKATGSITCCGRCEE